MIAIDIASERYWFDTQDLAGGGERVIKLLEARARLLHVLERERTLKMFMLGGPALRDTLRDKNWLGAGLVLMGHMRLGSCLGAIPPPGYWGLQCEIDKYGR